MTPSIRCDAPRPAARLLALRAADHVAEALAAAGAPAGDLRVRIGVPKGGGDLVVGQVNLTAGGWELRAQSVCESSRDVGAQLAERLVRQTALLAKGHRLRPWPDPLVQTPPLPAGPTAVTRGKRVALRTLAPSAAVLTMDERDYQAHLFTDAQTGTEAIVYRNGPHGYRLARATLRGLPVSPPSALVTDLALPPTLTTAGAVARIAASGESHLFFIDASTSRGALLYARYAGGYGLIEPAP